MADIIISGEIGWEVEANEVKQQFANVDPTADIEWEETLHIKKGDKIGQMFFAQVPLMRWMEVEELSPTERGEGGWGSSDSSPNRNH